MTAAEDRAKVAFATQIETLSEEFTVMAQWQGATPGTFESIDLIEAHGGSQYFAHRSEADSYATRQQRLDQTIPGRWDKGYGMAPDRYQVAERRVARGGWRTASRVVTRTGHRPSL